MEEEYIIISKTALLKRRAKLASDTSEYVDREDRYASARVVEEFDDVLANSTPLIPQIVAAWDAGFSEGLLTDEEKELEQQDYILNLKL